MSAMFGHCASELYIFLVNPQQYYGNKLSKIPGEKQKSVIIFLYVLLIPQFKMPSLVSVICLLLES